MFQLVNDRVGMVSLSKSDERVGPAQVLEKTGVPPALVAEWQALTGDSVDNIPGLPGVGPKTASRWLNQFGSLQHLLARRAEIGNPRFKEALDAGLEIVARNLDLMKLRRDLPVAAEWEAWKLAPSDPSALLRFYEKMDLESLARPLRPAAPSSGQGMLDFGPS